MFAIQTIFQLLNVQAFVVALSLASVKLIVDLGDLVNQLRLLFVGEFESLLELTFNKYSSKFKIRFLLNVSQRLIIVLLLFIVSLLQAVTPAVKLKNLAGLSFQLILQGVLQQFGLARQFLVLSRQVLQLLVGLLFLLLILQNLLVQILALSVELLFQVLK